MPLEYVTTIATVPAVIALVTLFKDLGLPKKLSPLIAVLLGVALSLFAAYGTGEPVVNWYEPVAMGLILGLSASGLYDGAKAIGSGKQETVVIQEVRPAALPGETREAYRLRTGQELIE